MNLTQRNTPTPEELAAYHANGFAIFRGVLDADEVRELQSEAVDLLERVDLIDSENIRCWWQNCVTTGECRFDCFDPVTDIGPVCGRVARDPRLLGLISALYGESAYLFKDKLIFKPAGALGYALHQDYISWPSFPKSFLTAIVAIDGSDAVNGATEVFPGFHTRGCMTPEDGTYHELPLEAVAGSKGVVLQLSPGDVAVFSGFTPHRSGANASSTSRRLLYLSYNSASDGGDRREVHYAEFRRWLQDRYAEYGKTNTFFR